MKHLAEVYRSKQRQPTKTAKQATEYVFVFTTVCADVLSATKVMSLYRSRWQIELVFKRLKSIIGIGHLPKYEPESAKAWLHGKLFCALLIESLVRAARFFSPWGYPLEVQAPSA
jgi:transposase